MLFLVQILSILVILLIFPFIVFLYRFPELLPLESVIFVS